jgi:hypothetical protein
MRRILVTCLPVLMCATAAHSAVLSLRAVGGSDEATLALGVSETAAIEIVLELDEFEEATGAHVFLDTVMIDPPGAEDEEAFGVIGVLRGGDPDFVWTGVREFSPAPIREIEFEDLPPGEGFSIDTGYFLVALMAEGDSLPGEAGVSYILDRIIIHGMEPGTIELTFEGDLRPPEVFGSGWGKLPLTLGLGDFGVATGPPLQQRERRPITITVGEPEAPGGDEDGAGGGDAGDGGGTDEGGETDDGTTDSGGDQSGDVIDEPGQEPDEGEGQTDTDGEDTAAPDDVDGSGDQPDTGEDVAGETEEQPGDGDPEVPEAPDDSDQSSSDEITDGSGAGGEGEEAPSGGPEGSDSGETDDSSTSDARVSGPCGFGVIPAVLASLLGLLAMQPHSRRRP